MKEEEGRGGKGKGGETTEREKVTQREGTKRRSDRQFSISVIEAPLYQDI